MIFTKKERPHIYAAIRYCWNALNRKEGYHTYCSQVAVERTKELGEIMIATDGRALYISTLPSKELEPGLYVVASVSGQKGFSLEQATEVEPFPAWRKVIPFANLKDIKRGAPEKSFDLQAEKIIFPTEPRETQYALARIGILLNERYLLPLVEENQPQSIFKWTFWAKNNGLCLFRGNSENAERLALVMGMSTNGVPVFNGFNEP